MNKFGIGDRVWTWELNVHHKEYGIYNVKVLAVDTLGSEAQYKCQLPDDSTDWVPESFLYKTNDEAVSALNTYLENLRKDYKNDILEETKRIYRMWSALDYCTDVLEELAQTPPEEDA